MLTASAHADNPRLRFHGTIRSDLKLELKLNLNPSNPFCWGKTKSLATEATVRGETYELSADWDAGACAFHKGALQLWVTNRSGKIAKLQISYQSSNVGDEDFRQVAFLHCGEDPEFGQFDCMATRADESSLIGEHLAILNGDEDYAIDVLGI